MACAITALSSNADCGLIEGGVLHGYIAKKSDITSMTFVAGAVTAIVMSATGLWFKISGDIDNTALFDQPPTRNGNIITHAQRGFMKFKGFTAAYRAWAQGVQDCCDLVIIWRAANGTAVIQGIEEQSTATGGFVGTKVLATRMLGNLLTDVGGAEPRLEADFQGTAYSFAPFTTLTDAAIEAL